MRPRYGRMPSRRVRSEKLLMSRARTAISTPNDSQITRSITCRVSGGAEFNLSTSAKNDFMRQALAEERGDRGGLRDGDRAVRLVVDFARRVDPEAVVNRRGELRRRDRVRR